jgi:hypothetical protein
MGGGVMMVRRPLQRRGARSVPGGLGDTLSDQLGFLTTGKLITWDQLAQERAANWMVPAVPQSDGTLAGQERQAAASLSLNFQQGYIQSLLNAAQQQTAQPGGLYYEPAIPAYVISSTTIPAWEMAYLQSTGNLATLAQYPSFGISTDSSTAAAVSAAAQVDSPVAAPAAQPAAINGGVSPASASIMAISPAASSSAAGAAGATANQTTVPAATGLASIPWWVWALGAGVVLWFFMEGRDG